jgi:autotransporter-associated beta strand protein
MGESSPGSGFVMVGAANLFLKGANTYTGKTEIDRGTTWLGAAGALPSTTTLTMVGGTLNFANREGVSFDQSVASLSGTAGTIDNPASDAIRSFTVNQANDTVFAGKIEGGLSLVKLGPGRLSLTGVIELDGLVTVAGGELSLSHAGVEGEIRGGVAVQSGGTLTGTGTIFNLTVAAGGRVELGEEVGRLFAGLVTLQAGASLGFDLDGTAEVTAYDQLQIADTLGLNGPVNLELSLGFQPALGNAFTLVLNDGMSAIGGSGRFDYAGNLLENFEQFTVTSSGFEQLFEIRYDGGTGNDVVITAVPEPASAVLLLGGAALCLRRRRKQGQSSR